MKTQLTNTRAIAANLLHQVIDRKQSLSDCLPRATEDLSPSGKGQVQDFCYGTLRQLSQLSWYINQLIEHKLSTDLNLARYLIAIGMYQLQDPRVAEHAAISETVEACNELGFSKLKGLVNGLLRGFQRTKLELEQDIEKQGLQVTSSHPQWLISELKKAYPKSFKKILKANLKKPPLTLRINQSQVDIGEYLQALDTQGLEFNQDKKRASCVTLTKAVNVEKLPGFERGSVSVQDKAAQQAAWLMEPQAGERVLDVCAAPGGKTAHMLELQPQVTMQALDIDENRLARVTDNLTRLQLSATTLLGDAANPDNWWDGQLFDRILLDAPCSATGVIRRHPDIMYLRRQQDIVDLSQLQSQILSTIWTLLKPGGTLVYATCSVLPAENKNQIKQFLSDHSEAKLLPIFDSESEQDPGWQILPGAGDMDGFYYARLQKSTQ